MTATKPRRTKEDKETEETPVLNTKLTEAQILAALGKPADLHRVDVHRYSSARCRVNVWRALNKAAAEEHFRLQGGKKEGYAKMVQGIDHAMARTITIITDSFYLRTNYDGSLHSDNEPIQRKYNG